LNNTHLPKEDICFESLSKAYGLNCSSRPIFLKDCITIENLFLSLDNNGDGVISKDQAKKMYTDKAVNKLFNIYDSDNDGNIEKDEVALKYNLNCNFNANNKINNFSNY